MGMQACLGLVTDEDSDEIWIPKPAMMNPIEWGMPGHPENSKERVTRLRLLSPR